MKHEEFLKQVKMGATYFKYMNGSPSDGQADVLKLLAIIEKLKEQQRKMYYPSDVWDAGGQLIYDKELDAIVGHP